MGMIHSLRAEVHGRTVLRLERVALPAGGVLAVLGKGGCGKSTLLRALCGRLDAQPGWKVHLEAEDLPAPITFVPQRRRSEDHCWEGRGPAPCSGGLPATCPFSRPSVPSGTSAATCAMTWSALLQEALRRPSPLLLLDEPDGGVPDYALDALAEAVRELRGTSTIVLVTHHIGFARKVCDSALFLEDGQKVMQAGHATFFHGPAHMRVQEFLKWGG